MHTRKYVCSEDTIDATGIGRIIVEEIGLGDVEFHYTGGKRGWKCDVPRMLLAVDRLGNLGGVRRILLLRVCVIRRGCWLGFFEVPV